MRLLVALGLLVQSVTIALPPTAIQAIDAPNFIGSKKVVCGDVRGVRVATKKDPTRIDLGRAFPDEPITFLVASGDRREFSSFFDGAIALSFMCVEGKIERIDGNVALKFRNPGQLKAVGPSPKNPRFPVNLPRCGSGGLTPPTVLRKVEPKYTGDAMRAQISGPVTMEAVIQEDGSVGEIQLTKSLDPLMGLDESAIAAARKWKFQSSTKDGQPVTCTVTLVLEFRLH